MTDQPTCTNCDTTRPTFHGIGDFRLCVHCWLAWRAEVHIHQGGTLHAYCGKRVTRVARLVAWEEADDATCAECIAAFAPDPMVMSASRFD